LGEGIAGRCEVAEDGYEEQIIIPKEKRELAAQDGIQWSTLESAIFGKEKGILIYLCLAL